MSLADIEHGDEHDLSASERDVDDVADALRDTLDEIASHHDRDRAVIVPRQSATLDDARTLAGLGVLAAEAVIAPPTHGETWAALISARACMRAVSDTTADALARRLLREEIAAIDATIGPARGRAA